MSLLTHSSSCDVNSRTGDVISAPKNVQNCRLAELKALPGALAPLPSCMKGGYFWGKGGGRRENINVAEMHAIVRACDILHAYYLHCNNARGKWWLLASLGERLGPLNPPMFLGDCTPKPPKYALDKGVNPSKNLGCPTSDPLLPLPFRSPFPLPSFPRPSPFPWRAPLPKPARGPGNGISSPTGAWIEDSADKLFGAYLGQKEQLELQQFLWIFIRIN